VICFIRFWCFSANSLRGPFPVFSIVSFLCNATRKGFDLDFPKTLNVASTTFASVVSQKHGGKIIERKKEQSVDMKQLQFIASLQLVESALQVCPDNVPEKVEKRYKIETERIKKLNEL